MTMVLANMQNNTDRHFWLFDTFEGLPEPGPKDDPRSHMLWKQVKTGTYNMAHQKKRFIEDGKFNYGPKELVKNNLLLPFAEHFPFFAKFKREDNTKPSTPIVPCPAKQFVWFLLAKKLPHSRLSQTVCFLNFNIKLPTPPKSKRNVFRGKPNCVGPQPLANQRRQGFGPDILGKSCILFRAKWRNPCPRPCCHRSLSYCAWTLIGTSPP